MKNFLLLPVLLTAFYSHVQSQVLINEIQSANTQTLIDEDGDYSDWIELYNAGSQDEDLSGYWLSDNAAQPLKWKMPSVTLQPEEHLLIFCSEKDRKPLVDHFETVVYSYDSCRYIIPAAEPDPSWKNPGFDDSGWDAAKGSIGYGDGDDSTEIPVSMSVYIRYRFDITDTSKILQVILHADYDDAFVAYINGVEAARGNIGIPGVPPPFDQPADGDHEAALYWGGYPESYILEKDFISQFLVEGENVIAFQLHNTGTFSSDLSSNFFFSAGITDNSFTYQPTPYWFGQTALQLHTNFKISSTTNEVIALSSPSGVILDQKQVDYLTADFSMARTTDGSNSWCISSAPTPGFTNEPASCHTGYLVAPSFSVEAGFYSGQQTVTIFNNNPDCEVRYSLDGSTPSEISPLYTGPVLIDSTCVIKARAFPLTADYLTSSTSVNTYFINETMTNAVVSISLNPGSLWDVDTGMYVFGDYWSPYFPYYGSNFWEEWEYPGHVEFFDKAGTQQFEMPMGVQLQGNWSKGFPQKSFQVRSHDYWGGSSIQYQVFPQKGITSFENFNLRNGGIDWNTVHFRDDLMQTNCRGTHVDFQDSYFCVLFLNGEYWGVYELREREDENYIYNNHGADPRKVDLLRYDGDVMAGSADDFWAMVNFISGNDMQDSVHFETASNWLDLENFADYFIAETYYGNSDWLIGYTNNIKYWRVNDPPGKWRYMLWDLDGGLGLFTWYDYNMLYDIMNPWWYSPHLTMFNKLLTNAEYKKYFINRYADLMNTIFTPGHLSEQAWDMRDSFAYELPRHLNRWGELNPEYYGWGTSINMPTYNTNFSNMLDFITNRPASVRSHIESNFSLPTHKNVTLQVSPPGAGLIKISTIIPDSLPWTGIYFKGNPVRITAIPNAGFTFDHWEDNSIINYSTDQSIEFDPFNSETFTAVFTGAAESLKLSVSEIMHHPDSTWGGGDWIELHNYGSVPVDISDWKVKDGTWYHEYVIPTGTVIPPLGYLVLADDVNKFKQTYPAVLNVTGPLSFSLDNNTDEIQLIDRSNVLYSSFAYHDSLPWPKSADGWGRSLELINDISDPSDPLSWFDGCVGGSPGSPYSPCMATVVVGEINYRSDVSFDSGDWVELYNSGNIPVDISEWKFCDENFSNALTIPPGIVLDAGERLVVCNDVVKFTTAFPDVTNVIGPFSFGLDAGGEPLRLFDQAGILYNSVVYDDKLPWPIEADGLGYTLELKEPSENLCDGNNYFAGCYGGSPGEEFEPCITGATVGEATQFSIYPNPATEFVVVESLTDEQLTLELVDISGKTVIQQRIKNARTVVDLHELASGIYFYSISSVTSSLVGKLLKQ